MAMRALSRLPRPGHHHRNQALGPLVPADQQAIAVGPAVAAAAHREPSGDGFVWIADGNERDPAGGDLACGGVRDFLAGQDLLRADMGELLATIDRDLLPAAARARGLPALPVGVLVARVVGRHVTVAHVGEARAHVLAADGALAFVSREHNVYNLYPQPLWRDQMGYAEEQAKTTILGVLGGGTADVELHLLPRRPHGALVAVSHMWHGYAEAGAHLE